MPAHPRDLARHDCIYLGEDERDRHWRFERPGRGAADAVTVKVRGRYVADHSEVRREAAVAGLGIATLPDFTAASALTNGSLVRVLPDWRHATAYAGTAWLLYPPNRFLPARVRAWIGHVAAHRTLTGPPRPPAPGPTERAAPS